MAAERFSYGLDDDGIGEKLVATKFKRAKRTGAQASRQLCAISLKRLLWPWLLLMLQLTCGVHAAFEGEVKVTPMITDEERETQATARRLTGEAPTECSTYTVMDDPTRSVTYAGGRNVCDGDFNAGTWYRFQSSGVDAVIPTSPPPINQCNTEATGWYTGSMPGLYQTTTNWVCYNWQTSCQWPVVASMSVTQCVGFVVYKISGNGGCLVYTRICTEPVPTSTTSTTTVSNTTQTVTAPTAMTSTTAVPNTTQTVTAPTAMTSTTAVSNTTQTVTTTSSSLTTSSTTSSGTTMTSSTTLFTVTSTTTAPPVMCFTNVTLTGSATTTDAAQFWINGQPLSFLRRAGPGFRVLILDPTGGFLSYGSFDTSSVTSSKQSSLLASFLTSVEPGSVVMVATVGEASAGLEYDAIAVLKGLGARQVSSLQPGAGMSYGLIAVVPTQAPSRRMLTDMAWSTRASEQVSEGNGEVPLTPTITEEEGEVEARQLQSEVQFAAVTGGCFVTSLQPASGFDATPGVAGTSDNYYNGDGLDFPLGGGFMPMNGTSSCTFLFSAGSPALLYVATWLCSSDSLSIDGTLYPGSQISAGQTLPQVLRASSVVTWTSGGCSVFVARGFRLLTKPAPTSTTTSTTQTWPVGTVLQGVTGQVKTNMTWSTGFAPGTAAYAWDDDNATVYAINMNNSVASFSLFTGLSQLWPANSTSPWPQGGSWNSERAGVLSFSAKWQCLFLYGGDGPNVWAMDVATGTWAGTVLPGPAARDRPAAAVHPATGNLYIFGGQESFTVLNDFWVLEVLMAAPGILNASWAQINTSSRPGARQGASMTFSKSGKLFLFGGSSSYMPSSDNGDLWSFDVVNQVWSLEWDTIVSPGLRASTSGGAPILAPWDAAGGVLLGPYRSMYTFNVQAGLWQISNGQMATLLDNSSSIASQFGALFVSQKQARAYLVQDTAIFFLQLNATGCLDAVACPPGHVTNPSPNGTEFNLATCCSAMTTTQTETVITKSSTQKTTSTSSSLTSATSQTTATTTPPVLAEGIAGPSGDPVVLTALLSTVVCPAGTSFKSDGFSIASSDPAVCCSGPTTATTTSTAVATSTSAALQGSTTGCNCPAASTSPTTTTTKSLAFSLQGFFSFAVARALSDTTGVPPEDITVDVQKLNRRLGSLRQLQSSQLGASYQMDVPQELAGSLSASSLLSKLTPSALMASLNAQLTATGIPAASLLNFQAPTVTYPGGSSTAPAQALPLLGQGPAAVASTDKPTDLGLIAGAAGGGVGVLLLVVAICIYRRWLLNQPTSGFVTIQMPDGSMKEVPWKATEQQRPEKRRQAASMLRKAKDMETVYSVELDQETLMRFGFVIQDETRTPLPQPKSTPIGGVRKPLGKPVGQAAARMEVVRIDSPTASSAAPLTDEPTRQDSVRSGPPALTWHSPSGRVRSRRGLHTMLFPYCEMEEWLEYYSVTHRVWTHAQMQSVDQSNGRVALYIVLVGPKRDPQRLVGIERFRRPFVSGEPLSYKHIDRNGTVRWIPATCLSQCPISSRRRLNTIQIEGTNQVAPNVGGELLRRRFVPEERVLVYISPLIGWKPAAVIGEVDRCAKPLLDAVGHTEIAEWNVVKVRMDSESVEAVKCRECDCSMKMLLDTATECTMCGVTGVELSCEKDCGRHLCKDCKEVYEVAGYRVERMAAQSASFGVRVAPTEKWRVDAASFVGDTDAALSELEDGDVPGNFQEAFDSRAASNFLTK